MKYYIGFIALLLVTISCEEEINSITLEDEKLVVEGYLYAGAPVDSIRITKVQAYSNTEGAEPVDDLEVILSNGINEYMLESIGAGYYSLLDHDVQYDSRYSIKTVFEGDTIYAETYVLGEKDITLSEEKIRLEKIEFNGGFPGGDLTDLQVVDIEWNNPESNYYFVDIENIESDPEFVNEIFAEFAGDIPETFFTSEPAITSIYSINSNRELRYFGTYEITVYRLNVEYAALYSSVGSSTLSLAEPPSNIENGFGIFTAVTPHTLYLEVEKK